MERFEGKYMVLETFRKSGLPVRTLVWFVGEGGSMYLRTTTITGKVKRLRNNPRVRIAPSNFSGKVLGNWMDGEASVLDPSTSAAVERLFGAKYGVQKRLVDILARLRGTGYIVYRIRIENRDS